MAGKDKYIIKVELNPGTYYVKELGHTDSTINALYYCSSTNPQSVKEFKSIRNAVIQEALKITPFIQRRVDVGQRLRIEEERPFPEDQSLKGYEFYPPYPLHQQEKSDDRDDDSAISVEQRPTNMIDESEKIKPVEPVYIPSVARSASTLMAQLARMFQEQDQQREKNQHQKIDRKQRREIDEKKQALGIRD